MSLIVQPLALAAARTGAASGTSTAAQAFVTGSKINAPALSLRVRKIWRSRDMRGSGTGGQDRVPP
jgi:hypothetical protein